MDTWHDAGEDNLVEAQPIARLVAGKLVMVVRRGETIHAVDGLCPHKFAALEEGTIIDGGIKCPQHEATFNLATGVPGEGEEWAGRLPVHEARTFDGRVQVRFTS